MTTLTNTSAARPRRRALRVAASAALTGALVVAAPIAAQAHVTVSPDAPVAGGSDVLTFAFSHGCDDSPTTALAITMPEEGLDSAVPTVQAGWSIDVERDASTGVVSTITYTADEPVPNAMRAAVELSVRYAQDAPESLAFPVEQICEEGTVSWSEIAEEGQDPDDLESPAPLVTLAEAPADAGADGHDHDASTDAESDAGEDLSALPVALGAGGLLAGVAALVVSVLAYRRSTRA